MAGEEHYCDGRRHNLTALPGWELQRQRGKRFKSCTQNSKYYYTFYFHLFTCVTVYFMMTLSSAFVFTWLGGVRDSKVTFSDFFFLFFVCEHVLISTCLQVWINLINPQIPRPLLLHLCPWWVPHMLHFNNSFSKLYANVIAVLCVECSVLGSMHH